MEVIVLQLLTIGDKVMENAEKHPIKEFFKKFWTKVKPFLPAIALGAAIILVVILLTYMYFVCSFGFIPSDRIIDENAIKKSDWLMFWGSLLAVFCTLSLAIVSYRQNKDLKKINDDREKKDTYFAGLRFSAEFFSQIEFENIYLKRQGVEVPALEFEIKSIGKCPPSNVDVKHFSIYRRPLQNNFEIESKENFELYSLRKTTASVVLRKTKLAERTSIQLFSISKPIRIDEINDFMEKYNHSEGLKSDSQKSSITAQIELTLTNPLEVETYFLGELTLRFKPSWFNSNHKIEQQEEIMFNVLDSSIETLVYKYIGHPIS